MFKHYFGLGKNCREPRITMSMGKNISAGKNYKWVRDSVDCQEEEEGFNFAAGLSVYVVTYNLGSNSPKGTDLSLLLSACEKPPDIYAIGFQGTPTKNLVGAECQSNEEWIKTVMSGLHPNSRYSIVETVQLGPIMLMVAVRNSLLACGILWSKATVSKPFYKTKGAVGISLLLRSANVCFVNAHFVPNKNGNDERQGDYEQILQKMRFQYNKSSRQIVEHDAIFFFGDLNYRLSTKVDRSIRCSMDGHWLSMFRYDQLRLEMERGHVFDGFKESNVHFGPTYKFDTGTSQWDTSDKAHDPAWCDRILWRGTRVKPMAYRSVMGIKLSNHKPVYGVYEIQNELISPLSKGQSRVTLHQTMVAFPMIRFYESYMETFAISNSRTMNVTVRFSMQQESEVFHENWIRIEPKEVTIEPGKTLNICLHIRIDSTHACVLQSKVGSGKPQRATLGHIVLQQANELDQHVTVVGTYLTSVFGHTMETLSLITSNKLRSFMLSPWEAQPRRISYMTSNSLVPKVIEILGKHLYEHGLLVPHLFGDQKNQRAYRDHQDIKYIRNCLETDLHGKLVADPRAVAEVLLMVLESAPVPLIDRFDIEQRCTRPIVLKDIVFNMSTINRAVFLYVLKLLQIYISHRSYNKCDIGRLAIVFGTVLMKEHPCKLDKSRSGPIHDANRTMFMVHILSADYAQCFIDDDDD